MKEFHKTIFMHDTDAGNTVLRMCNNGIDQDMRYIVETLRYDDGEVTEYIDTENYSDARHCYNKVTA